MNTRKTKFECPICNYSLCYRDGDKIKCLGQGCNYNVLSKRKDDKDIQTIGEIRQGLGEA